MHCKYKLTILKFIETISACIKGIGKYKFRSRILGYNSLQDG